MTKLNCGKEGERGRRKRKMGKLLVVKNEARRERERERERER